MDLKVALLVVIVVLALHHSVEADFFYNRVLPRTDQLDEFDFKCIPGRTIIKMGQQPASYNNNGESVEEGSGEYLRSHMRWQTDDPYCQICVCSVEAKDEYCSKRPAMNVNECIRMAALMEKFHKNEPFDHERSLSYRIRRDYLWHNDEIPYEAKAKCRRGHSYYSNSINANDTDIDVASDIESLLDYSNKDVCFYCVCTMDGNAAGCLSRSPWFCEYFRFLRERNAQRDMYTRLFQQDRPVYFRTLSWRLRRTMDTGMFDLMDSVGNGLEAETCVPFVSEYSDCTEDNLCTGCSKCTCTADAKWDCNNVQECPDEDGDPEDLDDNDLENALEVLEKEMQTKEKRDKASSNHPLVPEPEKLEDLLLEEKEVNMEDEILALMRSKRSPDRETVQGGDKKNDTIKFYHAIDELNEDTLKHKDVTGTLPALKVDALPQISRRTNMNNSYNPLHIEYTQPKDNSHHDDNKVDTPAIHDDKEDLLVHSNIYGVLGNHSKESKDKELSKLLVNELKGGVSETIGDKEAPVISNITFTPQNDTLTAMAFIAGNLLNKLWNMEKDASDDDIDTEVLKHEKIGDLLELFKEPLSIRQEMFLKNALEQLSTTLNKNKDLEHISLCKDLDVKSLFNEQKNTHNGPDKSDCVKGKRNKKEKNNNTATSEALNKMNNVLDLIKKYENVQNSINNMKTKKNNEPLRSGTKNSDQVFTKDEESSLDLYGKTLKTITKLLIPTKKSKKVPNSIQSKNLFKNEKDLKRKLSDLKLDNVNITSKDKIVLDYLSHIQSNPDCLFKKQQKGSLPSIEGNILLNLSEFFKIKSLSDLLKLVDAENIPDSVLRSPAATTTTQKFTQKTTTKSIEKDNPKLFIDTKEKLKGHLKSILEDLMELQKVEGNTKNKDIQIMDALPCIYNLLNAGKKEMSKPITTIEKKQTTVVESKKPSDTIKEIFSNLKKEMKLAQTRRTNPLNGPRPKSAVVWERVIKNAESKQKIGFRRNLGEIPKSMKELRKYMDKVESSGSNTYKNYAYLNEVPPAERLLLLKTFNADTMRYAKAMKTIMTSLEAKSSITKEAVIELNEFIDNVAININLNDKVVKNLDKPKKVKSFAFDPKRQMKNKAELLIKHPIVPEPSSYDTKLTREQIINQLIKNRLQLYVDTKEAARETRNDMNYDIAKQILFNLEVGKFELARELYKIFVNQKQKSSTVIENKNIDLAKEQVIRQATRRRPLQVEPLIKFEDPKTTRGAQMVNQDNFIKQLLNLKNMKLE